jgi:hypothetical protein
MVGNQARAICAGVAFFRDATALTRSTSAMFFAAVARRLRYEAFAKQAC